MHSSVWKYTVLLFELEYQTESIQNSSIRTAPCENVPSGHWRTSKAQISLRIREVWSGPPMFANRIIRFYRMLQWRANARMRFRACAGWYESAHLAHARWHITLDEAKILLPSRHTTLKQRRFNIKTLNRRCFNVVCPLGNTAACTESLPCEDAAVPFISCRRKLIKKQMTRLK